MYSGIERNFDPKGWNQGMAGSARARKSNSKEGRVCVCACIYVYIYNYIILYYVILYYNILLMLNSYIYIERESVCV